MNPNIEVITPVLWGVNSFYVKAGWTKELLPIPQPPDQLLTGSKNVSLTDNGIMVLHKESELYPTLKKFVPRIMEHSDEELVTSLQKISSKSNLDNYEKLYKSVLEWEIKRREIYYKTHQTKVNTSIFETLIKMFN